MKMKLQGKKWKKGQEKLHQNGVNMIF